MVEVLLTQEIVDNCAIFARALVYEDCQYSRMLPIGIDEESEIAKTIETQRHFIGKIGECAFLKLVEDEVEKYKNTLEKMKVYLDKHINNLNLDQIKKLKETILELENNISTVDKNLEITNKNLFKIYANKKEADEYDFVGVEKNGQQLKEVTIDVKTASLHFHSRLQVNNKQFDSTSLKKDYYIGAHIKLRKEDCFVISEEKKIYITENKRYVHSNDCNIVISDKEAYINHEGEFKQSKRENSNIILTEKVKTHILKKPLEKILQHSNNKVYIYGYISHKDLENKKADGVEGACREIKLDKLCGIQDFFNKYIFYSSKSIKETRELLNFKKSNN